MEKVLVGSGTGLGVGTGPESASDPHLDILQAKQQAHLRSHMAEESKNEYAAQLQRFNRDQAHFYFSQMPQIFDVSALSAQPHLPEKDLTVNHLLHICPNPRSSVPVSEPKGVWRQ